MRGPQDDQVPDTTSRTLSRSAAQGQKPPGGKALQRLVQLLELRGYDGLAETVVEAAVQPEAKEAVLARAHAYTGGAERVPLARTGRSRKSNGRSGARTTAGAAEESRREASAIAYEHIAAAEQMGPPTGPPVGGGATWRSIGPTTIPNGQTYNGAIRVNVSGRVAAIAIDPTRPAHVLCGSANGGVWESFNRGASWAPRTDYQATTAVGALTFDPTNASVVYCGTGEGNWWSFLGTGILRSVDGGTTWAVLCTNPFVGQGFFDLRVDPGNRLRLVAATTGGLYVSVDGGTTWVQRRTQRTWSLSFGAGEILAASQDGLVRSSDSGATWTAVTLPGRPTSFDRLATAIAASNPAVAYAWGAAGTTGFLWRRAAGAWTAVASLPPGLSTGQAWYDWYLAVAPDRDSQIYLGAIEAYRGDLSGTTWTWTVISNHTGSAIHPDQHAIAFEPGSPNTIYAGSDGGVFRSGDRGQTWIHCNNGLVISEFEYIAQNVGSSRWLLGGTQDNGTERWIGAPSWDHVADGDGGYVAVNHDDPSTVFHTFFNMSPERSATGGHFGSWTFIPPPIPAGENSLFYPPMRCTDSNGATVAIGGGALYVSRTNGSPWTRLAFPSAATASALSIPNADSVFVGATDGRVFKTTWNGTAWTTLAALTTPRAGANVSDVLVSAATLTRIWVTYSRVGGGRVYRSDDGGAHWTDCSAGLPNLPVNAIEIDTRAPNRLWVAMDRGISESRDAGGHWADFSNGLPNCFVGDLAFHPHAWVLRAGTRNRGVWEIPVDGWMTVPECGVQFQGALAANQTKRWFTFNWPATWHIVWTVMPTSVDTVPQVTWTVQVQRASAEFVTYWLSVQNLTAKPVTFDGRFCVLSRY
ncbi:MAG: hypothetical protein ABI211_05705 [Vicinamibacterales bacterium]